jgi:hypothetical protein
MKNYYSVETGFQTYFNPVLLGYRLSEVNTMAQTRRGKNKG